MVAGNRALKFEEKARERTGRLLVKECLKEKEEGKQKTKSEKEKEEYLKKNGMSMLGLEQERIRGKNAKTIAEKLRRCNTERKGQIQYNKIQKSRYNKRYKHITTVGQSTWARQEKEIAKS